MMAAAQQLLPSERCRLDEHLATCDSCSNFYQDMMVLAGAVATAEPSAVTANRTNRVLEFVPPTRPPEVHERAPHNQWWLLAAASVACFACGMSISYVLMQHQRPAGPQATAAMASTPRKNTLPQQASISAVKTALPSKEFAEDNELKATIARLQAKYEAAQAELAGAHKQDQQSAHANQELQADLAQLRLQATTQQTTLSQLQSQLDLAHSDHAQDTKLLAMREEQLRRLTADMAASNTELAEDRKVSEAFRLMAQRNLHVVDVYDNNKTGQPSSTFGRVFYSEGGPMMFVAFDLPGSGPGDKTVYHAWGKTEGSSKKPLQLGTFTKDDGASQRWVMRVNETALLKQVDAVFITADHGGNVRTPNGPPLLYAYLRQVPNHP